MTSDPSPTPAPTIPPPQESVSGPQVRFKQKDGRLLLLLPPSSEDSATPDWNDVYQQLKQRLLAGDRFWEADTLVHLIAGDRLLDTRQLRSIADGLADSALLLKRVYTSRRQTAVAAATAGYSVEQHEPVAHLSQDKKEQVSSPVDALYVETTVRSGVEIRHSGSVIVMGDVNPGGAVVADGDVIIWGILRGVAQAGAAGNTQCRVMALRMEPTQIRIAKAVARSPETPPDEFYPEVAYATPEGIRIVHAQDFARSRRLSSS